MFLEWQAAPHVGVGLSFSEAVSLARDALLRDSPSVLSSLVALTSLRAGPGRYDVRGDLSERLGPERASGAAAALHSEVFFQWLNTPVTTQLAAVEASGRDRFYVDVVPESAAPAERAIFNADLAVVLALTCSEQLSMDRKSSLWCVARALWVVKSSAGDARITLYSLAQSLSVSPNHLGRVFHEQSGLTCHQYMLTLRMIRAAHMLRSGGSPLKQVAATLGYGDTSNLCKDFRATYYKSPRSYRVEKSGHCI